MPSQDGAQIMGIINITPDSFSDGGSYQSVDDIWRTIEPWCEAGISWIDLGAESSRPGAQAVGAQVEWQRLAGVLQFLSSRCLGTTQISIDSRYPETWQRLLEFPQVGLLNVISGDPRHTAARHVLRQLKQKHTRLRFLAMHLHGNDPATMQHHPLAEKDVVAEVEHFFLRAQSSLAQLGFTTEDIYLDPGIGFGKTVTANLALIEQARLWSARFPLAYGLSRKSFIGELSGEQIPKQRDGASQLLEILTLRAGARLLRTHNPLPLLRYLQAHATTATLSLATE